MWSPKYDVLNILTRRNLKGTRIETEAGIKYLKIIYLLKFFGVWLPGFYVYVHSEINEIFL